MSKPFVFTVALFLVSLNYCEASTVKNKVDSIFATCDSILNDSTRIEELAKTAWSQIRSDYRVSEKIIDSCFSLLDKSIQYDFFKGKLYMITAEIFKHKNQENLEFENFEKAIAHFKSYTKHNSRHIQENAKKSLSAVYNNLANSYNDSRKYTQALEFYHKSLSLMSSLSSNAGLSTRYINMGAAFVSLQQYDSAEYYLEKSFIIETELNNVIDLYWVNYQLANLFNKKGDLRKAENYVKKAIEYGKKSNEISSLVEGYELYAGILLEKKELVEATNYYHSALELAKSNDYFDAVLNLNKELAEVYNLRNDYKWSSHYYQRYAQIKDSIDVFKASDQLAKFKARFDDEQKEQQIALLKKDRQIQQNQEKILWGGLAAVLLMLALVFNSFRTSKKSNQKLNEKNTTIEAINKEVSQKNLQITDSINYAEKIQRAVLPPIDRFKQHFDDAFVFFQPKDIVSGDFYWGTNIGNKILFTVADCTGHGVPGAFMSLIGSNLLDKIVGENAITEPNLVLDKLHAELHQRLQQDEQTSIKDGMDLVLCCIDLSTLALQISGAYNPAYIIRKNELIQFKTDKFHIGNIEQIKDRKFQNQHFQLQKGDLIYLFSDGFPDQKGGPDGKKFFYPPFRDLLLKNSKLALNEQKNELQKTISSWIAGKEQFDDILVLGIKI